MLQLRREGYSDVARVDLGPAGEFMFMMSAESTQEVAVEKAEAFSRRVTVPLFETLELDCGIVYEQGSRHRRNKRLCLPSFEAKGSLVSCLAAVHAEFEALRERWRSLCEAGGGQAEVDLYVEMRKYALDIVLRVTFGLGDVANSYDRDDELSATIKEYLERVVAVANEVPPIYQVAPWLSPNYIAVVDRLLPKLRELVDDVIAQRRKDLAAGKAAGTTAPSSRADLLSLLLADQTIDDREISRILCDIIIAASDTTASTLSAALYVLHEPRHRNVQLAAAREEAARVDASLLSFDELKTKLPYTLALTREILRLYPPVPFIGRTSVADATVSGYAVKKGSTAVFSPWYLGRDTFAWGSSAEEFQPERWIANYTTGGAPTANQWLPFGAGLRGCLGTRLAVAETLVGISRILREFDFSFQLDGELQFSYDIFLNLEGSTRCTVTPRKLTSAGEKTA